jgi:DNA-directed RNA polymerase specialized sigma subunit
MRRLPARERYLVEQHYLHGRVLSSIAREFGIGDARASQIKITALTRLRRWLAV